MRTPPTPSPGGFPGRFSRPAAHRAGARVLLALLLAGLTGSCGYRLHGDPGSRHSASGVAVDLRPFANASMVPDAGAFLAAKLREEMRRGGFRGSFDPRGAEYLIEGEVRDVGEAVFSHGGERFALEHRLTLVVDIRVVEMARGRVLWKGEGLAESASYFAGSDFQYTEANRRVAFEEVCRRMARRIGQSLQVLL